MININARFDDEMQEIGLIGHAGESGCRRIVIDCADVLMQYPDCEIIAVVQRPGDAQPYSVTLEASINKRIMVLQAADVERFGLVRIEVRAIQDGVVLKSAQLVGTVERGIQGEGDAPGEPIRDVLDRVEGALEETEAALEAAQAAMAGLTDITAEAESGDVASASFDNETHVLSLVLPRGERGEQGPAGATGPQGPQGEPATVTRAAIVSALGEGSPNLSTNDYSAAEKQKNADNAAAIEQIGVSLDGKQDAISDLEDIREGAGKGETALQPGDVADVAMSGSAEDVTYNPYADHTAGTVGEAIANIEARATWTVIADYTFAAAAWYYELSNVNCTELLIMTSGFAPAASGENLVLKINGVQILTVWHGSWGNKAAQHVFCHRCGAGSYIEAIGAPEASETHYGAVYDNANASIETVWIGRSDIMWPVGSNIKIIGKKAV